MHALFSGKIEREVAAKILGWCLATIRYEAANGWIDGGKDTREWVEQQLHWSEFLSISGRKAVATVVLEDQLNPVIQLENEHLVQSYKRPPFVLARGEGMTLYDTDGKAYQDWVAGIAVNALGYGDPGLTQAIQQAAAGLIHTSNLYYTEPQAELAAALCRKIVRRPRVLQQQRHGSQRRRDQVRAQSRVTTAAIRTRPRSSTSRTPFTGARWDRWR